MLQVTCYGGVGEIGGNKILLEDDGSALMLDFGKRMGAFNQFFDEFLMPRTNSCLRDLIFLGLVPEVPGIYRRDLLSHGGAWERLSGRLPDHARRLFSSDLECYEDYLDRTGRPRIDGILLSHAHADHVQDLCFVDRRIPVYCSRETRAILQAVQDVGAGRYDSDVCTCRERSVEVCTDRSTFPEELKIETDSSDGGRAFSLIEPFNPVHVGGFTVEAVPVDHSVPGALAYVVQCPSGRRVLYTGDLRFRGASTEITSRLRAWCAGLRPDVLITEGTRIVDGNGRTLSSSGDDEAGVESRITDIVRDCAGLVIVDFGWKDTARLRTIVAVAKSTGRTLVVNPKVAYLWALLGKDDPNSYPDFESVGNLAVYLERLDSMTYSLADYSGSKHTVGVCLDWGEKNKDMRQAFLAHDNEYLRDRLCHYYSGIRAYDIAADPARFIVHAGFFDMNELFDIAPPPGSVFISAMTEPFCDEMEIDQRKLKNWLDYFGIDYGGDRIQHYHVSGHANGQDLLDFIRSVEPKLVVPVHTEHPEAFVRELVGFDVHLPEYGRPFSCP